MTRKDGRPDTPFLMRWGGLASVLFELNLLGRPCGLGFKLAIKPAENSRPGAGGLSLPLALANITMFNMSQLL